MSLAPISNDNIRVGYISDTGYVSGVSVSDANKYEENKQDIEVEVHSGGQPLYAYYFGVE